MPFVHFRYGALFYSMFSRVPSYLVAFYPWCFVRWHFSSEILSDTRGKVWQWHLYFGTMSLYLLWSSRGDSRSMHSAPAGHWPAVHRYGPCTYRHTRWKIKDGKWTPIFHFPFTMKNEKWKMDTQFHFSFFIANGNTKWATEKVTKTTTHILVLWHNYCWNCYLLPMSTFVGV